MFSFLDLGFILSVVAIAHGFATPSNQGIEGATKAPEGAVPYIASLRRLMVDGVRHKCGGAILSNRWILSTAECTRLNPPEVAVVGTNHVEKGGDFYNIEKIIDHEGYRQFMRMNVVSLLKTDVPIGFNAKVQPIRITDRDTGTDETVLHAGWGRAQRDIGNPVTQDGFLVGIVTQDDFYIKTCGFNYPDIYVRLFAFKEWIHTKMDKN